MKKVADWRWSLQRCTPFPQDPPSPQKKQLVIVVKGLDNPFFEAIHQGCEKWNKENASSRL